jgi:hypothetical protein
MPKPKIAQLVQSPKGDEAVIVELAADEAAIVTGTMGGCVSVVVLWHPVDGVFQNVRGHHASGGAAGLDWDKLMRGVPAGDDTLIVVAYSQLTDKDEHDKKRVEAAADDQVKARRVTVVHSNCLIDRKSPTPTVSEFKLVDEDKYEIRVPAERVG